MSAARCWASVQLAMECYEAHTNALEEEEETVRKVVRELSAEERISSS